MSTSTVMPEATNLSHFASCTRDTIGAVVLRYAEHGVGAVSMVHLVAMAEAEQEQPGHCTCVLTRLNAVKDQIRRTKKALKANGWSTSETLAELIAHRDALLEAVAR